MAALRNVINVALWCFVATATLLHCGGHSVDATQIRHVGARGVERWQHLISTGGGVPALAPSVR